MLVEVAPLVALSFVAGMIDAAVGGGGLIQIPGMFALLPHTAPATLFGTNKFASICGTFTASLRYARSIRIEWKLVIPAAVTAFIFAFLGAKAVSLMPTAWMRPLVLALLSVMLVYTLWKKDFGALHRPSRIGPRQWAMALGIGGAIGFYDGFFGPGTGSFLIFLFIRCFGFDFLRASAAAKAVNVATNFAALTFFIPAGNVLFHFAIPMAAANIAGAVVGARMAMKGGTPLIRILFMLLVAGLIGKLAWDMLK